MSKEKAVFLGFLKEKGLKLTEQRGLILDVFLKIEKHLSVEDLYGAVKRRDPSLGRATVFRTLKLLCEAGIARDVDLGDGRRKFEHGYGHSHHDHIICEKCFQSAEVFDPEIERLQDELCKKAGFLPTNHRLEIFGICRKCRSRRNKK